MSNQQQEQEQSSVPTSPESDIGSTYSSPHRRRGQTRREALDQILKNRPLVGSRRPIPNQTALVEGDAHETITTTTSRPLPTFPQEADSPQQDGSDLVKRLNIRPSPCSPSNKELHHDGTTTTVTTEASTTLDVHSLIQHRGPPGYSALSDDYSDKTPVVSTNQQVTTNDEADGNASHPLDGNNVKRTAQHEQQQQQQQQDPKYYRITYQGVVALLSEPHGNSAKSGAYVSYGEVIMSQYELPVEEEHGEASTLDSIGISPRPSSSDMYTSPESPPQSVLSSHNAGSVSSLDTSRTASTTTAPSQITTGNAQQKVASGIGKKLIRVDKVLTGGYAVDALDVSHLEPQPLQQQQQQQGDNSNLLAYQPMVGPSPLPLESSRDDASSVTSNTATQADTTTTITANYGYLYTRKRNVTIAEPLTVPPILQSGTFLFQVVSSAPLPIFTGPCVDAPRTRAMLLPGTVHEVCLKMTTDEYDITFLRLSHRRGWITDRRVTALNGVIKIGAIPAAKEVTDVIGEDDVTVSAISLASASIASTGASARRRHRPPRRKREATTSDNKSLSSALPRHVGGGVGGTGSGSTTPVKGGRSPITTPQKQRGISPSRTIHDTKIPTPSSNISILSDDESFDLGSSYRFPTGLTPDRSTSSSVRKRHAVANSEPNLFLMLVNAPRGLKILDAPHFQVSNLIHGQNEGQPASSSSSQQSPSPSKGIFQTMATHHTAKALPKRANQIGNPAVFDSITKTRMLPRGVVFEASKRIEASGAYNRGAGLVKLSDNSGWAIIPHQDDLHLQYRNYQGGAASVREGEGTRAFEEVGNAVVDSEDSGEPNSIMNPPIWVRVVAKNGVTVSCPPPVVPVAKDDDTSPTSSAGSSSVFSGGGSNYGAMSGPESDVASSVGSAFLDAMFRTPKKPTHKTVENRTVSEAIGRQRDHQRPVDGEFQDIPNLLPCGSCVEVDRWEDSEGHDDPGSVYRSQDYVRLRGGQGWIPLNQGGMTVSAVISKPDIRLGSFWFRVTSRRGIKVRLGPSRKAGSIKSDDGDYFRFECGEFLRASEVLTVFHNHDEPSECYAKLYRNRHVRLNNDDNEYRQLLSLTTPAEWVQVFSDDKLFLEECGAEPEILRHRQGWRYNVIADAGVSVLKGPSLNAEETGVYLLVGESVVVTERVTAPGEQVAWLRLKNGEGWVCDTDSRGQTTMIAHSLRHRARPRKANRPEREEIAYNSIVARLFHDGVPGSDVGVARQSSSRSRDDEMRNRRQMH